MLREKLAVPVVAMLSIVLLNQQLGIPVIPCRCLDCGPFVSLCESCAIDKHRTVHIFHHVEILKNGIYLPLEIPRTLVWPHHQCSNGVHYRGVIIVNEKDGHTLAKQLSHQITKATRVLKASLGEYNKTECSSACSLPQLLELDSVKDPDSTVWTEAGDLQGWRTEIPMAIKRKAVDLYCLVDRCGEEITLLKGEMNSTVHHFSHQHQLLRASLQSDSTLENCSPESKGRDLLIRRKLMSIEGYLRELKDMFGNHVEDQSLPDLLFKRELPSVRPQKEHACEISNSVNEGSCLLSLPENYLHFSESESGLFSHD